jgi:uncharacterized protein (TIGR03435 family)
MKVNLLGIVIGSLVLAASAQTPAPAPAFEVASIKLSELREGSDGDFNLGRLRMQGTLRSIIRIAYEIPNERIDGGPKWLDDEHYEINAKAEGPAQTDELRAMLQTLLADRFGLRFHRVTKTLSGYTLKIADSGLKIKEVEPSDSHSTSGGSGSVAAKNVPMSRVAAPLSTILASPVVDETGNTGFFDFTLTWSPEKTNASVTTPNADDPRPSLFTAVEEQLGLKLERRRVPADFIEIDQVSRPTLN